MIFKKLLSCAFFISKFKRNLRDSTSTGQYIYGTLNLRATIPNRQNQFIQEIFFNKASIKK